MNVISLENVSSSFDWLLNFSPCWWGFDSIVPLSWPFWANKFNLDTIIGYLGVNDCCYFDGLNYAFVFYSIKLPISVLYS